MSLSSAAKAWCFGASLLSAGYLAAAQQSPSKEPLATVTVRIIDESGHPVYWEVGHFASRDRDMTSHFHGLRGADIPYGEYQYSIRHIGTSYPSPVDGRVFISSPEPFLLITLRGDQLTGMTIDGAPRPGFVIRGKLEPPPAVGSSDEPVWIRLQPAFLSYWPPVNVSVSSSGEFRIYDVLSGLYLLTVLRGEQILHVQPVSFENYFQAGSFLVRTSEKPPLVISVPPDKK